MKVVLFCGGLGTRLKEFSDIVPKPMVDIGYRPIMWHLMMYYAHYGHKDFILCLGYRGDMIKNYFLNYDESLSNDFILKRGGKDITLLNRDIDDWTITFVDTGQSSNLGERLLAVRPFLEGEDEFMANYTDGLTDLHLPTYIDHFHAHDATASFLSVQPSQSFHVVRTASNDDVESIRPASESGLAINGGFFLLKNRIFDYIRPGEELVYEPFERLIAERQLLTFRHGGFWACMDTFKEKKMFDAMYTDGHVPWAVWEKGPVLDGRN